MLRSAVYSGGRHLGHHRLLSTAAPSATAVAALFSHASPPPDPIHQLQSLGLDLSRPDAVHSLLASPVLAADYAAASHFFSWASSQTPSPVNSRCFNCMLQLAAAHGDADRFWSLAASMRSRGYGISKSTFLTSSESFQSKNMAKDAALLQEAYAAHATNAACGEVCKILRSEDPEDERLTKLQGLGIEVTDELVELVLDKIGQFPHQAMVFFRWVEGFAGARVHWSKAYNAMARILGREDCIEEFREVLGKMRIGGYELERATYVTVSERFHKRRMVGDVVDLYRFTMSGSEKLSTEDFMFLLKKVVVSGDVDLKLVTSLVRIYQKAGNVVKSSVFDAVLKSLRSVVRLGDCDRVLKAMEEGGFAADSVVHGKAVLALCDAGKLDEAHEYLAQVEESGYRLDPQIWSSLVQKYSLGDNVDMAVSCFHEMLQRRNSDKVGCALEVLVSGLCKKKGAKESYKVLKNLVLKKVVVPWHTTYTYLIHRLIHQGHLKEACDTLGLMKSNGFPPFIDPFIAQISKSGTVDDALGLLKAMSAKEFPSRTVYMRLFQALFKEGRHEVAQQLLSKSPGSVHNHADVLDLFYTMKLEEPAAAAASS